MPNLHYLAGLKLAHPVTSDTHFEISLLIGADYYWQFVQDEIVRGEGPVAVKSKLGYLLSGPVPSNSLPSPSTSILNVMILQKIDEPDIERFWTLESLGIESPTPHQEIKDPLADYRNTSIIRENDGGYVAAFPLKNEHHQFHRILMCVNGEQDHLPDH